MNPILNRMNQVSSNNMINMLMGKTDPNQLFNQMLNNNPQFSQFIRDNKGLTPEQIASKYGVNLNNIKQFIR